MINAVAFPEGVNNPPALAFTERKTCDPGKSRSTLITATFGLPPPEQVETIEQIGTTMAQAALHVRAAMAEHPGLTEAGKR